MSDATERNLGSLEYRLLVVLAVLENRGVEAYSGTARRGLEEMTGHLYAIGSIWTVLQRLENKNLVTSLWSEKELKQGGKRKRFYQITLDGIAAVKLFQDGPC